MNIIQLASYSGNIGDNANVSGTRRVLRENIGREIQFTDLEFEWFGTDSRWARRSFDQAFVDEVNRHDLFLVGGGGFFGLTTSKTFTGTPLTIPLEILRQIKTPIVFYALGFHAMDGHVEERATRFKHYLDGLLEMDHVLVSVRNDGSRENLRWLFGDAYVSRVFVCPDGGFFSETHDSTHVELERGVRTIALQLGGDRLENRFATASSLWEKLTQKGSSRLYQAAHGVGVNAVPSSTQAFLHRLAIVFGKTLDEHSDVRIVLLPHIPSDYKMIEGFLGELGHYHARNHVTVAPYLHGDEAHAYLFDLYKKCVLTVGMRFHANVCPIGLNVPTIGLVTYSQIQALYDELGLSDRALSWDDPAFEHRLEALIQQSLSDPRALKDRYLEVNRCVRQSVDAFHQIIMDKFFYISS